MKTQQRSALRWGGWMGGWPARRYGGERAFLDLSHGQRQKDVGRQSVDDWHHKVSAALPVSVNTRQTRSHARPGAFGSFPLVEPSIVDNRTRQQVLLGPCNRHRRTSLGHRACGAAAVDPPPRMTTVEGCRDNPQRPGLVRGTPASRKKARRAWFRRCRSQFRVLRKPRPASNSMSSRSTAMSIPQSILQDNSGLREQVLYVCRVHFS